MSYQALYRKFRPRDFEEVYGQNHVVTALKNQLTTGRIGHAYVFSGTRGTGKTSIAKIFSQALNCMDLKDGNPCGVCESCKRILKGSSLNVKEIDGASNNKVDNVRDLIEDVKYPPAEGTYKVYIIDEAHMVTTAAFNALLKTIEEPPAYAVFILATTEEKKIPITILSRCQRYYFHTITVDTIADRLAQVCRQEGVDIEDRAIRYIARLADGSLRDGLSILDKTISFYAGEHITYDGTLTMLGASDIDTSSRILRAIIAQDTSTALKLVDESISKGLEPVTFVSDFVWYLRNILLIKNGENVEDVIDVTSENREIIKEEAKLVTTESLMRYISLLSEVLADIKYSAINRIGLDMGIIRLCQPRLDNDLYSVQSRLSILEERLKNNTIAESIEEIPFEIEDSIERRSIDTTVKIEAEEKEPLEYLINTEDIHCDDIKKCWPRIADSMGGFLKTYLGDMVPKILSEDKIEIGIPKNKALAKKTFEKPENVEKLISTIENITGKRYEIKIADIEPSETKTVKSPDDKQPEDLKKEEDKDIFADLRGMDVFEEVEE